MNHRVSTLQLFCRVARTGSFTAAGQEVGLTQPSVSRIISALEKELGAALFVRSTHAVNLTEVGEDYLKRLEPILLSLEEANHMLRDDGTFRGRLRVGSSTSFAIREVIPRLPSFLEANPDIHVDFVLSDSMQQLIGQGIDVALRFGALTDSTMVARKLIEAERILVASVGYLEKNGHPQSPADLAKHRGIIGPSSSGAMGWSFEKNGEQLSVQMKSQLMVTVNEASTAAALAGMGIISTSILGCRKEIESGELIRLLPDWKIGFTEVHAVIAAGHKAKPSARGFVDYLASSFREAT